MINKYWNGFWWLDALGFTSSVEQNDAVSYDKNLIEYGYIPNPDYYTIFI